MKAAIRVLRNKQKKEKPQNLKYLLENKIEEISKKVVQKRQKQEIGEKETKKPEAQSRKSNI
jgi:hypothetical protein